MKVDGIISRAREITEDTKDVMTASQYNRANTRNLNSLLKEIIEEMESYL
jgi:hypothetical protein